MIDRKEKWRRIVYPTWYEKIYDWFVKQYYRIRTPKGIYYYRSWFYFWYWSQYTETPCQCISEAKTKQFVNLDKEKKKRGRLIEEDIFGFLGNKYLEKH